MITEETREAIRKKDREEATMLSEIEKMKSLEAYIEAHESKPKIVGQEGTGRGSYIYRVVVKSEDEEFFIGDVVERLRVVSVVEGKYSNHELKRWYYSLRGADGIRVSGIGGWGLKLLIRPEFPAGALSKMTIADRALYVKTLKDLAKSLEEEGK